MKTRKAEWTILLCVVATLAITIPTSAQTITTFDVPGDVDGITTMRSSRAATISGFYLDADDVSHAFLRAPDGDITTFDVPGCGRQRRYPGH